MATVVTKTINGHGPYAYLVEYAGGEHHWTYLGRAGEVDADAGPLAPDDPRPEPKHTFDDAGENVEYPEIETGHDDEIEDILSGDEPVEEKQRELSGLVRENTNLQNVSLQHPNLSLGDTERYSRLLLNFDSCGYIQPRQYGAGGDILSFSVASPAAYGGGTDDTEAGYIPKRKKIVVSPQIDEASLRKEYEDNWTVTDDVEGLLLHELGHHRHHVDGDGFLSEENRAEMTLAPETKRQVEDVLSEYAAETPNEFVGEAFAYQAMGGDLPPYLVEMYDGMGGPDIPGE